MLEAAEVVEVTEFGHGATKAPERTKSAASRPMATRPAAARRAARRTAVWPVDCVASSRRFDICVVSALAPAYTEAPVGAPINSRWGA
jgi:hypothetical protein